MRGHVEGLTNPHPFLDQLPVVYRDDEILRDFPLARELTQIFDDVLAPAICALDNFDAYIDPELAPLDFVEWLAGWVGFPIGDAWPEDRSRDLVARASELYNGFGTVKGLRTLLATYVGIEPEVTDTGGVSWSTTPGSHAGASESPPRAKATKAAKGTKKSANTKRKTTPIESPPQTPHLTVRLPARRPRGIDLRHVEALIAEAKPAHVTHTLEVGR